MISDGRGAIHLNFFSMAPEASPACAAILVTGAGSDDVNGLYVPTGRKWHEAEIFENDKLCMLSREPHKSQKTGLTSYGWILGQDRKPMYAVQSEEILPPKSGWKKFTGQVPIPAVDPSDSLKAAAETAALAFKDQGNALFTARSYKEAATKWSRALSTLEKYCSDSQVRATLYANRAESNIRMERWEEALLDCEAALVTAKSRQGLAESCCGLARPQAVSRFQIHRMLFKPKEDGLNSQSFQGSLFGSDVISHTQAPRN